MVINISHSAVLFLIRHLVSVAAALIRNDDDIPGRDVVLFEMPVTTVAGGDTSVTIVEEMQLCSVRRRRPQQLLS